MFSRAIKKWIILPACGGGLYYSLGKDCTACSKNAHITLTLKRCLIYQRVCYTPKVVTFCESIMNAKHPSLLPNLKTAAVMLTAAGVVVAAAFSVERLTMQNDGLSMNCAAQNDYNNALPSSHPSNRCANQRQELTWRSWFSGKSRSGQFHFIDLMELLNGHQTKPIDGVSPTSSHNS